MWIILRIIEWNSFPVDSILFSKSKDTKTMCKGLISSFFIFDMVSLFLKLHRKTPLSKSLFNKVPEWGLLFSIPSIFHFIINVLFFLGFCSASLQAVPSLRDGWNRRSFGFQKCLHYSQLYQGKRMSDTSTWWGSWKQLKL